VENRNGQQSIAERTASLPAEGKLKKGWLLVSAGGFWLMMFGGGDFRALGFLLMWVGMGIGLTGGVLLRWGAGFVGACLILLIASIFSPERSDTRSGAPQRSQSNDPGMRSDVLQQPQSGDPNVLSVLDVICEGEGILDTGRYSADQQQQLFKQRYAGKRYFVRGRITDVGEEPFRDRKRIVLQVTTKHYFDILPAEDFNLLAFSKGQEVGFTGTWTEFGTGIMFHHKIEQAQRFPPEPTQTDAQTEVIPERREATRILSAPPEESRSEITSQGPSDAYLARLFDDSTSRNTTPNEVKPSKRSPEDWCRAIAQREYPEDQRMQRFVYDKQIAAYRYMATVTDDDVKQIARREYPEDFSMQKFVYDKQGAAKRYMTTVADVQVKQIAIREYPSDHAMQKFVYDQQLSAKQYMTAMPDGAEKQKAIREYPSDFTMQKFTYDQSQRGR
jgi:hypothetical protein